MTSPMASFWGRPARGHDAQRVVQHLVADQLLGEAQPSLLHLLLQDLQLLLFLLRQLMLLTALCRANEQTIKVKMTSMQDERLEEVEFWVWRHPRLPHLLAHFEQARMAKQALAGTC